MTGAELYGLYAILAVLAGGVYLAMPTERSMGRRLFWAGLVVIAAGLAGTGVFLARWIGAGEEGRVFFIIFALLAIAAAVRVVTHRRPVYSAVYLVLVVLAVTGLCVLGAAEFLAAALVIVYGGAILVTYIFVIMLAQQEGESYYDVQAHEPFAAVVMGFALVAAAMQAMLASDPIALHAMQARKHAASVTMVPNGTVRNTELSPVAPSGDGKQVGNVRQVGATLAREYMIAVQAAGILMLVAMVGAIAIARKKIEPSERTPHEQAQMEEVRREPVGRFVEPFARVRREHR